MTNVQVDSPIVARAGRYYRRTRYVIFAILLGVGVAFTYDGYWRYPAENEKIDKVHAELVEKEKVQPRDEATNQRILELKEEQKKYTPHTPMDLRIQRALGIGAPPLGILLLAWWLHKSRGSYMLAGETLSVPGHPEVSLAQIRRIDKTLWDRKGIAFVEYEIPGRAAGRLKLDDFVYDAAPTRKIVERIDEHLAPKSTDSKLPVASAAPTPPRPAM